MIGEHQIISTFDQRIDQISNEISQLSSYFLI